MARVLALLLLALAPLAAGADEISVALTEQQISIDEGFSGARIILYGVVSSSDGATNEAPGDLIVIVRGPAEDLAVRPKVRTGPIWTPGEAVTVKGAPSFYFVGATRPPTAILDPAVKEERQIGAAYLNMSLSAAPADPATDKIANDDAPKADAMREAVIDAMRRRALYREEPAAVDFLDGGLFRVAVDFPANTPVGFYQTEIYLVRDGDVVSWRTAPLYVEKVGLERRLYDFAHEAPLLYGLMCVAVSLFAGWLASVLFRRS